MNNALKEITILANILSDKTHDRVLNILLEEGEQETSDLIELVISSHFSSMFNCMRSLAKKNPPMLDLVNNFITEMTVNLSKMHPITNIQMKIYNE